MHMKEEEVQGKGREKVWGEKEKQKKKEDK